jgi:hypothetical protein
MEPSAATAEDERAARAAAEEEAQANAEPEAEGADLEAEPEPQGTRGCIVLHSGVTREIRDVEPVNDAFDGDDAVLDLVDLRGRSCRVRSEEIALCETYPA